MRISTTVEIFIYFQDAIRHPSEPSTTVEIFIYFQDTMASARLIPLQQ